MNQARLRPLQEDVEIALRDIEARAPGLSARQPGTVLNAIAGTAALLKRDAQRFTLEHIAKTYVQTAEGQDLDLLARDHYGIQRHATSRARGHITLILAQTSGTILVEQGSTFQSHNHTYEVTARTHLSTTVSHIPVQATTAGVEANRPPNSSFTPSNQIANLFANQAPIIYNQEPIAGGAPPETDTLFRERIALHWLALRRGTPAALRAAALNVPGIRHVTIDEARARPHKGAIVDLYAADHQGSWSGVLIREIRDAIDRDARAAGIVVNVQPGRIRYIDVNARLTFRPGARPDARIAVANAIARAINALPIGATLHTAAITHAALASEPSVHTIQLISPPGDIAPANAELLRVIPDDIVLQ